MSLDVTTYKKAVLGQGGKFLTHLEFSQFSRGLPNKTNLQDRATQALSRQVILKGIQRVLVVQLRYTATIEASCTRNQVMTIAMMVVMTVVMLVTNILCFRFHYTFGKYNPMLYL